MVIVPVSQQQLDDAGSLSWLLSAAFDDRPLTLVERLTGWRTHTDRNGLSGRYAVGWRARHLQAEADRRREAEMAACPYVACTCGHHEEE